MIKKTLIILFSLLCIIGIVLSLYKIINWKMDVDENKNIQKKLFTN